MSELRRLKANLPNCYLDGFFIDGNTFLKADDADLIMVLHRDENGKAAEKSMIVLKNVVEMTVDHKGKVVAVENKPKLGVWVDAFQHALERFNKSLKA